MIVDAFVVVISAIARCTGQALAGPTRAISGIRFLNLSTVRCYEWDLAGDPFVLKFFHISSLTRDTYSFRSVWNKQD